MLWAIHIYHWFSRSGSHEQKMELWQCPAMDGSQKTAILTGVAMQDRAQKPCNDDLGKLVKQRLIIQEATHRLFREWAHNHNIRLTDLWGNAAPKGADTKVNTITVPAKEGRHWSVKDLQRACVTVSRKRPSLPQEEGQVHEIV